MKYKNTLVWLRHDLRLDDHTAMKKATAESESVHLLFVFDTDIVGSLEPNDKRVTFIWDSLAEISADLESKGIKNGLRIVHGRPEELVAAAASDVSAECVYASDDYEQAAMRRDIATHKNLVKNASKLELVKNTVIFHKDDVLKDNGEAYKVFSPYKRRWLATLKDADIRLFKPDLKKISSWQPKKHPSIKTIGEIGFDGTCSPFKGGSKEGKKMFKDFLKVIDNYKQARDFPSIEGTSLLSIHIRFGTVSIRELVRKTYLMKGDGAEGWVSELIWREFYKMILYKFPHVEKSSFQEKYKDISWPDNKSYFESWKQGMTGVPIIDAAMRHFNLTGMMHNRLRMVVAQFLTKDLLVHWCHGEKYFADRLLDFDLSANNGGWQWSASTGCDAQPYFRIFNPYLQSKRFDSDGSFIKKHVPELVDVKASALHNPEQLEKVRPSSYPKAIVSHKVMREKAIAMFKEG